MRRSPPPSRQQLEESFGQAARGETPASHRGRRGAPLTRRDDREYREYLREEQRSQRGCIAGRMQLEFHHGLVTKLRLKPPSKTEPRRSERIFVTRRPFGPQLRQLLKPKLVSIAQTSGL